VKYQANRYLPFIIDKISLNKDLTDKIGSGEIMLQLIENIFEDRFLML
jgi:hypothetical protein